MSIFNKSIVSIDLGTYETKIIQGIKSKEEIKVEKAVAYSTPMDSYENGNIKNHSILVNHVKEEMKENKMSAGNCHISISSTSIITRELPFPILGTKEIEGLLKYQLEEYLPMDYGKYIIQHKPLGRIVDEGVEKLNILVVAIPKDMVEMHYDFVRDLGLRPLIMDYQSNGIWKLFKFTDSLNVNDFSKKVVAAIDLGYSSTNITILKNKAMQTTKAVELGGQSLDTNAMNLLTLTPEELHRKKVEIEDISNVEEGFSDDDRYLNIIRTSLEAIMDRVDRVFKYYLSKEMDNEIEQLLLYGGLSNIKGIDKLFQNNFGISTMVVDNLKKVSLSKDTNRYVNCLGALIRDDEV